VRVRPPASVLLSVGTAAAVLAAYVVIAAMTKRDWTPRTVANSAGAVIMLAWFIDGTLRRRSGRVAAAALSLGIAGLWGLLAALIVFGRAATGRFDWTMMLWMLAPPLILSLIGVPLLRPSARAWYGKPDSPAAPSAGAPAGRDQPFPQK
jgi:amino acid transporter